VGRRPKPTGPVELVEESTTEGEDNEWMVTLRWQFDDDELVEYLAARAEPTGEEPDRTVAIGVEPDRTGANESQAENYSSH
jgi:hypothetical protein